jgi:hypothetical protein
VHHQNFFCSWGTDWPFKGIFTKFFLASSTAAIASCETSLDFPNPCPTTPFSPTTTIAENRKLYPFVTLVTSINTTKRSLIQDHLVLLTLHSCIYGHTILEFKSSCSRLLLMI